MCRLAPRGCCKTCRLPLQWYGRCQDALGRFSRFSWTPPCACVRRALFPLPARLFIAIPPVVTLAHSIQVQQGRSDKCPVAMDGQRCTPRERTHTFVNRNACHLPQRHKRTSCTCKTCTASAGPFVHALCSRGCHRAASIPAGPTLSNLKFKQHYKTLCDAAGYRAACWSTCLLG